MAKKRGFFAELNHQNQLAEKRKQQQANAAFRAQAAAAKRAEQAQQQAARAATQYAKATAAEQKAAEREAKRLHEESMQADVELRNAELASRYDEIDGLLAATLAVDDFVDLEWRSRLARCGAPFACSPNGGGSRRRSSW